MFPNRLSYICYSTKAAANVFVLLTDSATLDVTFVFFLLLARQVSFFIFVNVIPGAVMLLLPLIALHYYQAPVKCVTWSFSHKVSISLCHCSTTTQQIFGYLMLE